MLLEKIVEAMFQIRPGKLSSSDIPLEFCPWRPFHKNNLGSHMGTFWMSWCTWLWHRRLHIAELFCCSCPRKVTSPFSQKLLSPGCCNHYETQWETESQYCKSINIKQWHLWPSDCFLEEFVLARDACQSTIISIFFLAQKLCFFYIWIAMLQSVPHSPLWHAHQLPILHKSKIKTIW